MLQALDAGDVRRWVAACVQALDVHREAIDRINVYPVADGDTGSNLLHTMRSALESVVAAGAGGGVGPVLAALARGALAGAHGNSGVILSQFLRGFADAVAGASVIGPAELTSALVKGAELARAAVSEPVAGTMLSVLDAAAGAWAGGLPEVATAAAEAAAGALAQTPGQLAVLAEAGVVDAGGRGIVVLLDALVAVVSEESAALAAHRAAVARAPDNPLVAPREGGSELYAYEVMYLLDGEAEAAGRLREKLDGLGDCVSVVGGAGDLWTVHVHCNDIGAAIEAGIGAGRPHDIRVARFADAPSQEPSRFVRERAVVVPVRSQALGSLLAGEGVTVLELNGSDDAAVYRLLEVITGTGAGHVAVLPIDRSMIEVADEAAIRAVAAGQDVVVVPCSSPVQVLAAVAVHDPRRRSGDDVVRMAEAAAATRRGEVVVAEEDAITWIGPCAAGDVLGLADGEVVLIESGPVSLTVLDLVARGVVGRMLGLGGELVTALLGADAPDELGTELADYLHREHPEVDLVVYRGGQTDSVLTLGVE